MVLAEGDTLTERDLPDNLLENASTGTSTDDIPSGLTMDELERLAIEKNLERFEGNRTHAANALNISVRTLQRKLAQYEAEGRPIREPKEKAAT